MMRYEYAVNGRSPMAGYTLIEMLVVVVIMGILLSLVSVVATPNARNRLQLETERLAQLLNLAAAESRLTGKAIRWTSDGAAYHFWRLHEDGSWREIQGGDELLHPRRLPDGMSITDFRMESMQRLETMRLDFVPYGLSLAYTIVMSIGAERASIAGSPVGDAKSWTGPENPNDNPAQL